MKKFFDKVDKDAFVVPAILTVIVLIVGVAAPEAFGKVINVAFSWISGNLGWLYDVGLFFLLCFCLWAAFSKVGKIKLGGKDAKPNMSMLSWIAITFTSGMALGVVFYATGEGIMNFMDPPAFTGLASGSPEAAEAALSYVFSTGASTLMLFTQQPGWDLPLFTGTVREGFPCHQVCTLCWGRRGKEDFPENL